MKTIALKNVAETAETIGDVIADTTENLPTGTSLSTVGIYGLVAVAVAGAGYGLYRLFRKSPDDKTGTTAPASDSDDTAKAA